MCGDFAGFKALGHQADVIASSKVVEMYIHPFSLFFSFTFFGQDPEKVDRVALYRLFC